MDIVNFDIVSPVVDKHKPFYFTNRNSLVCRFEKRYDYYVECSRYNPTTNSYNYYLLLSKENFNANCRKINNDNYGRALIRLHDSFNDFVKSECSNRGNINVEYLESTDDYDVYSVE